MPRGLLAQNPAQWNTGMETQTTASDLLKKCCRLCLLKSQFHILSYLYYYVLSILNVLLICKWKFSSPRLLDLHYFRCICELSVFKISVQTRNTKYTIFPRWQSLFTLYLKLRKRNLFWTTEEGQMKKDNPINCLQLFRETNI